MTNYPKTEKTTLKRKRKRGTYDKQVIHAILDEGFLASVAISIDNEPYVQPMLYVRDDKKLIFHGSAANHVLNHLRAGHKLCANITLVDGLILGTSIPDHSANYRSVTVFGTVTEIEAHDEKKSAMKKVFDSLIVKRWENLPPLDDDYLRLTTIVFTVDLEECVAKVQDTGPADGSGKAYDIWSGVLPCKLQFGEPVTAADCEQAVPEPVKNYQRPQNF